MDVHSDSAAKADARVGRVLCGKWQLVGVLGVGGMGAVYEARHRNGARAAIKMLHDRFSVDGNVGRRFRQEAYLANAVEHPGVVVINDDDVDEHGTPFLVMDLVRGRTVEGLRVAAGGRLDADLVRTITVKLLEVLQAAHDKGITHRDIKPSNLLLTDAGDVKVFDFGVATCTWPRKGDSALSQAGAVLGTPSFMAPEQARSRWGDVDARTDLWAVGATMFNLLSGRDVHQADTSNEVLGMAMTVPAPSLRTVLPNAPTWLAAIVDRALCYERADRFQSASDMREALLSETGPVAAAARDSSHRAGGTLPPLRGWAFTKAGATATDDAPMPSAQTTAYRAKRVTLAVVALAVVTIVGAAFVNGLGRSPADRASAVQGLASSVVAEPSMAATEGPAAPAPATAASATPPADAVLPAVASPAATPTPTRRKGSTQARTPAAAPQPESPAVNAQDPLDQRL